MTRRVTRRKFLETGAGAAVVFVAAPALAFTPDEFDLVLKGGTILDGTGGPARPADVAIAGDSIVAVGSIPADRAKRAIDVSGLHVAPGFIDIHTHSDRTVLKYPTCDSRILQGVTTELAGNCGSCAATLSGVDADQRRKSWHDDDGIDADWTDVASFARKLEATKFSVNQALLLGQGTLRTNAVGNVDRRLTADELAGVLRAVEDGMDQGAFGVSTGLEYTPGLYTPADEIVEIARVVARRGGLYASHVRNEVGAVLEAVDEAIEVGRATGARVEVSHLKTCGKRHWPKQRALLDLIESARRGGVEVLADVYPYTAYSTGLTIFLEGWAREGSSADLVRRLQTPSDRARIRREVDARVTEEPGGYDLVVISDVDTAKNKSVIGKSIAEIAAGWKTDPDEALVRLLEEEAGGVSYIGHAMSPENVELVLSHPLVMIGSDGVSMKATPDAGRPHPRSFGTYARVLGHYVRERHAIDLPTAIRKMTSMPADQLGLGDRGRLARGKRADVVVFNAGSVAERSSFDDPLEPPDGIVHVVVNGVAVVEGGHHTGARPGRFLRKA
jgi:N-acyl-D-amino-acid deacylase